MRGARRVGTMLAAGFLTVACTHAETEPTDRSAAGWRARWAEDWNARVDAHEELRDHPCGDFQFDPWARDFLAPCESYAAHAPTMTQGECEARGAWAWERSRQCNEWQAWLLRHHHRQTRSDAPEPETRVLLAE